jgi:hypothetical protein
MDEATETRRFLESQREAVGERLSKFTTTMHNNQSVLVTEEKMSADLAKEASRIMDLKVDQIRDILKAALGIELLNVKANFRLPFDLVSAHKKIPVSAY